jgi:hypothetical protein
MRTRFFASYPFNLFDYWLFLCLVLFLLWSPSSVFDTLIVRIEFTSTLFQTCPRLHGVSEGSRRGTRNSVASLSKFSLSDCSIDRRSFSGGTSMDRGGEETVGSVCGTKNETMWRQRASESSSEMGNTKSRACARWRIASREAKSFQYCHHHKYRTFSNNTRLRPKSQRLFTP